MSNIAPLSTYIHQIHIGKIQKAMFVIFEKWQSALLTSWWKKWYFLFCLHFSHNDVQFSFDAQGRLSLR